MKIKRVDYQAPNAAEQFCESLHTTGFGILENHPIDQDFLFSIYEEWQDFFNNDDKFNYTFDKETQDGYFPYASENAKDHTISDLKEFFHVYLWGKYPKSISDNTKKLYVQMREIATTLLQWIEANTPDDIAAQFAMPLSEMITDSERTLLRVLHYPPLQGDEPEGAIRAAAHEDINLITVLPAATALGLQVQDRNGNWMDVDCDPGALVVNIADMLQMCSQGYYPSTTHRVVNPFGDQAKRSRLSLPLFLHPRDEVQLSTSQTANDYRLERLREIGLME